MEVRLHFSVFLLLVKVSVATWNRVTVMRGQTVNLTCHITDPQKNHVEWRNPDGFVIFFNHTQGLKDKRYSIIKLSKTEFSISISKVTFKDGGNYTCTYYDQKITETKVELTVLGIPRISLIKLKEKTLVKCRAKANHHPPQILWSFDSGPEFNVHEHVRQRNRIYESTAFLQVLPVMRRYKVKCRIQHPDVHSQTFMDFVTIGQNPKTSIPTTTSPSTTLFIRTTADGLRLSTTDKNELSSVSEDPSHQSASSWTAESKKFLSRLPLSPGTSEVPLLSSTGGTAESAVSELVIPSNSTDRNSTGIFMKKESQRSPAILILLVTCLIVALMVVVGFFGIKLKRAHFAWRRENEDSNPSEESNKSKSTQEDKNFQGQRHKGLSSGTFTQYVAEKPTNTTSIPNTSALTSKQTAEKAQSQSQIPSASKGIIKETSL
ncbi:Cytotoxic and regulatory T-cell molecule [Oryzias melastigma]|uniref:Cytotoxic and regulatory T-cell molecule n=1 Tax=Oryzias melastigma TaxID=30732 RepID=A0A834FQC6_ORYME|nr:Cytotoxic and regulatory T-cell molecule [Oryzias melastigma]